MSSELHLDFQGAPSPALCKLGSHVIGGDNPSGRQFPIVDKFTEGHCACIGRLVAQRNRVPLDKTSSRSYGIGAWTRVFVE